MRFREPLLGGSAAMPGASLQRACRLLVAVCALHLGVTLVYYLAGRDLSRLPYLVGVPTPLQGGSNGAPAIKQPSGELGPRVAAQPPRSLDASEPRPGGDSSPDADSRPGPASNLTSAPLSPSTTLSLPACPEESPLLGKDSGQRQSKDWDSTGFPRWGPRTFAHGFSHVSQPTYSGLESRIPNTGTLMGVRWVVPGWVGVRDWEVSPFGFMLEAGAGAVWGSRRPLVPEPEKALETSQTSRSFGV